MFTIQMTAAEIFHVISVLKKDMAECHKLTSGGGSMLISDAMETYWRNEAVQDDKLIAKFQEALKK